MKYCRYCGKETTDGSCDCQAVYGDVNQDMGISEKEPFIVGDFKFNTTSLSGFISSLRDQTGLSDASTSVNDPFERDVPIVPTCIALEKEEVVVKQYNIAKLRTRLKFMKAEGRLMVTNKRVLFRAAGTSLTGNILQNHQFDLEEIGGVEVHKDYKFSFLNFFGTFLVTNWAVLMIIMLFSNVNNNGMVVTGALLGLLGMAPTFIVYKRFWIKLFSAIVGTGSLLYSSQMASSGGIFLSLLLVLSVIVLLFNMMIVCFVPNLMFKLKTKSGANCLVIGSKKSLFRRDVNDEYTGFTEVLPFEDTVMVINEIGSLIDDLKKQGNYGIKKWS